LTSSPPLDQFFFQERSPCTLVGVDPSRGRYHERCYLIECVEECRCDCAAESYASVGLRSHFLFCSRLRVRCSPFAGPPVRGLGIYQGGNSFVVCCLGCLQNCSQAGYSFVVSLLASARASTALSSTALAASKAVTRASAALSSVILVSARASTALSSTALAASKAF
jgi:hypothetical protein